MPFSGIAWIGEYPNSTSTDDLVEPFRANVGRFLAALKAAGASVNISSTLRPPQRAHLMHYSFLVSAGRVDPSAVPTYPGVDIEWLHLDSHGKPDLVVSRRAAREMVDGYAIVFAPALQSKHMRGLAIDMDISWQGNLAIKDARGNLTTIRTTQRSGGNMELHAIGATFGVFKLLSDPPHWSIDGH